MEWEDLLEDLEAAVEWVDLAEVMVAVIAVKSKRLKASSFI